MTKVLHPIKLMKSHDINILIHYQLWYAPTSYQ